jgi:hypothetical protein
MKPALKEKKFVDILQYVISLLTLKYVFLYIFKEFVKK